MPTTILLDQPDLLAPGRSRRRRFGPSDGDRIAVLNGRGRDYEGGAEAPDLSLKWMTSGAADYRSEGRNFRLAGSAQLLLNPGQPYGLRFRGESESFTVFFSRALADRAWQSRGAAADGFPEFPTLAADSPRALRESLAALREESLRGEPDASVLEELSFVLLEEIASLARQRRKMVARVPALRKTTKSELLQRLARAEAYLIEGGSRPTLANAATAAALSPFHLIRIFRAVHGETPLAFAAGWRLERARDALLMTGDPIEEIARRAGYESRTAFDRAFQRRFRTTPGAVRIAL